eukprot:208442-Chlamydomonas_euryale.AAC.2
MDVWVDGRKDVRVDGRKDGCVEGSWLTRGGGGGIEVRRRMPRHMRKREQRPPATGETSDKGTGGEGQVGHGRRPLGARREGKHEHQLLASARPHSAPKRPPPSQARQSSRWYIPPSPTPQAGHAHLLARALKLPDRLRQPPQHVRQQQVDAGALVQRGRLHARAEAGPLLRLERGAHAWKVDGRLKYLGKVSKGADSSGVEGERG